MSDKINHIIEFMRQHTLNIQLDEDEDTATENLTDEELGELYAIIKEKIDVLMGKAPPSLKEREVVFNTDTVFHIDKLIDLITRDPRCSQNLKWGVNLRAALNKYGRGTINKEYLVSIGDPQLGLYTTAEQIEKEILVLKHMDYKFPNGSVQVSQYDVEKELNSVTEIYDEQLKKKVKIQKYANMSNEQREAVLSSTLTNSLVSIVMGFAGAGKSFTMGAIVKIYSRLGFDVVGVTLSSKAADVLESESGMKCKTIAKILSELQRREDNPFDKPTVLIVDEAGLVGFSELSELLRIITKSKYPVKLILSGDSLQLNPIQDANSLELADTVVPDDSRRVISTIRRQRSSSHIKSVLKFKDGEAGAGLYVPLQQENVFIGNDKTEIVQRLCQDFFNSMVSDPDLKRLVTCQDNSMAQTFNIELRKIMQLFGKVESGKGKEFDLLINNGRGKKPRTRIIPIAKGDKIMFTNNFPKVLLINKATGEPYKGGDAHVMNKLQGIITNITGDEHHGYNLTIDIPMIDEESPTGTILTQVVCNTKTDIKLPDSQGASIDLNYATTVYSSQGQTVDENYLVDSPEFDSRTAYVGASRHKRDVKYYINRQAVAERIIKRYKKNQNSYISTLEILDEVGRVWSQVKEQNSVVIHALKMKNKLTEIAAKNRINIDFNNLSNVFIDIYKKEMKEQALINREKGKIKELPEQDMDKVLDSAEYFVRKPTQINFDSIITNPAIQTQRRIALAQKQRELEEYGNKIDIEFLPIINKDDYPLHPIINEHFFQMYDKKIVSVGRGSEIRFLGADENGSVYSKYDIYGYDGIGIGYPVMTHSGKDSKNSDIYVIQDLNLYLHYLDKFYLSKKDDVVNVDKPIIIWGAKTTDYSHIVHSFEDKTVKLIGTNFFKYNTFFRITHAIEGLQLNTKFDNIDGQLVKSRFYPRINEFGEEIEPESTMPVNRKRFGDFCNPKALINIRYNDNNWNHLLKMSNEFLFGWKDLETKFQIDEHNKSELVDSHGRLSMEFIKNYILTHNLMSEQRFNDEVLARNKKIESFIKQKQIAEHNITMANESNVNQTMVDEVNPKLNHSLTTSHLQNTEIKRHINNSVSFTSTTSDKPSTNQVNIEMSDNQTEPKQKTSSILSRLRYTR